MFLSPTIACAELVHLECEMQYQITKTETVTIDETNQIITMSVFPDDKYRPDFSLNEISWGKTSVMDRFVHEVWDYRWVLNRKDLSIVKKMTISRNGEKPESVLYTGICKLIDMKGNKI